MDSDQTAQAGEGRTAPAGNGPWQPLPYVDRLQDVEWHAVYRLLLDEIKTGSCGIPPPSAVAPPPPPPPPLPPPPPPSSRGAVDIHARETVSRHNWTRLDRQKIAAERERIARINAAVWRQFQPQYLTQYRLLRDHFRLLLESKRRTLDSLRNAVVDVNRRRLQRQRQRDSAQEEDKTFSRNDLP